jgi:hypothetical protein
MRLIVFSLTLLTLNLSFAQETITFIKQFPEWKHIFEVPKEEIRAFIKSADKKTLRSLAKDLIPLLEKDLGEEAIDIYISKVIHRAIKLKDPVTLQYLAKYTIPKVHNNYAYSHVINIIDAALELNDVETVRIVARDTLVTIKDIRLYGELLKEVTFIAVEMNDADTIQLLDLYAIPHLTEEQFKRQRVFIVYSAEKLKLYDISSKYMNHMEKVCNALVK